MAQSNWWLAGGGLLGAPLLLALACGSDAAQPSVSAPGSAGEANGPAIAGLPALGDFCRTLGEQCDEGNGVCAAVGGPPVCARACEEQADCSAGLRCTDTGADRFCIQRCKTARDCAGISGSTCAAAGDAGERVCWYGNDSIGDVTLEATLVVSAVGWRACLDCTALESAATWRMLPGSTAVITVSIVNRGSKTIRGSASVQSKSPNLEVAWAMTPGIMPLKFQLFPQDYAGSYSGYEGGITSGVSLTYSIEAKVGAGAAFDAPLPFELVLTDGDGVVRVMDFAPRPLKSGAAFELVAEVFPQGASSAAMISVANVGYGAVSGLSGTLAIPGGTQSYTIPELMSGMALVGDGAYSPALLAIGNAVVDFNAMPTQSATVQLSEPAGQSWNLYGSFDSAGNIVN